MAVYFLQCQITGRVKVGKSDNPERRYRNIRTTSPTEIALLGSIDGGLEEEAAILKRLSASKVRGEGSREWHRPTHDLVDVLGGFGINLLDGEGGATWEGSPWCQTRADPNDGTYLQDRNASFVVHSSRTLESNSTGDIGPLVRLEPVTKKALMPIRAVPCGIDAVARILRGIVDPELPMFTIKQKGRVYTLTLADLLLAPRPA